MTPNAPRPRHSLAARLPQFPWDSLEPARQRASAHPDGLVDLSVGTPVDPTPASAQEALAAHTDAHGYPTTVGIEGLREQIAQFCHRTLHATQALHADGVLATIGSKELVAHLPSQLGIGDGDRIAHPHIAYPTYDLGARLAGAQPLAIDMHRLATEPDAELEGTDGGTIRLLWINSPSNPTGAVMPVEHLRAILAWARERDVIVASDECYSQLPWTVPDVPSILDERVNDGDLTGILATYSLSKQSHAAGYRAAFVAGDRSLINELLAIRKHSGMMLPTPIQYAMREALGDEQALHRTVETYRRRRTILAPAIEAAGGRIDHSDAGLYLWTTWDEECDVSIRHLAEKGILAAPGKFYGKAGARHVRIALTETDHNIAKAAERLSNH